MVLSAAERLAALDRSNVVLDRERCLHSLDQYSPCAACLDVCPVEAIQAGNPPALDQPACERCYACLPACPTGAYTADDAVQDLLQCAARAEAGCLELLCARHPVPESGEPESIGIQVRGCLAGLGASAYLSLAALGHETIAARTDACAGCTWGKLQSQIENQLEAAQRLLAVSGNPAEACSMTEPPIIAERPLWAAENPPLSRRDLFRMASRGGQVAVARAMTQAENQSGPRPSRERFRTLQALDHLPKGGALDPASLAGLGYGTLTVSDACTACGACARACPTAALRFFNREDVSFELTLDPRLCIGCEVCAHVCGAGAVIVDTDPETGSVFLDELPVPLLQGQLTRCARCNALLAAGPGIDLCPVCAFRRDNPFGSATPPGFLARGVTFQTGQHAGEGDQASGPRHPPPEKP